MLSGSVRIALSFLKWSQAHPNTQALVVFLCLAMAAASIEVVKDASFASRRDYDFIILRDHEAKPAVMQKGDGWRVDRVVCVPSKLLSHLKLTSLLSLQ